MFFQCWWGERRGLIKKRRKKARFHDDPSASSCKLSTGFNILSNELFFIHICHKGIGNVVYLDVF